MSDALNNVTHLRQVLRAQCDADRDFKSAMSGFAVDADRIVDVLRINPDAFRADRAFFLVKSKSLYEAIALYPEVKKIGDQGAISTYLEKLTVAGVMIRTARKRLDESFMSSALVNLDVLADQVDPADVPAAAPASRWGLPKMSSLTGGLSSGYAAVKDRTLGTGSLLTSLVSEGTQLLGRNISDPVMARVQAAQTAGESALNGGVVAGIIIGVLCPPLLPLTGGVAALSAIEGWNAEMAKQSHLQGAARQRRMDEIRESRKQAIAKITGGATALMTETEDLSVLVDGETGTKKVTLLTGPKAGRDWSQLSTSERKDETARMRDTGSPDTLWLLEAIFYAAL